MFKEFFRTKCEKDVESVKQAFIRMTGEDLSGLSEVDNPEDELEAQIRDGFLEFKDGFLIAYEDICD